MDLDENKIFRGLICEFVQFVVIRLNIKGLSCVILVFTVVLHECQVETNFWISTSYYQS